MVSIRFAFRRSRFFLLFAILILRSEAALAQAPDFVFVGNHVANGVPGTSGVITTLSDSGSGPYSGCVLSESSSAMAGGSTLTLDTFLSMTRSSGSGVCEVSAGYQFTIWAKHPGDITLESAGGASYSILAPNASSIGYNAVLWTGGGFSATQTSGGIVESGNSSDAGENIVNIACNGTSTTFGAYPGVTYYRVAPPSGSYSVTSSVRVDGGLGTVTTGGSQAITATYAATAPVAVIDDSRCAEGVGTYTITQSSHDDDSPNPLSSICVKTWAVTGPSSYSSSSNTISSPVNGTYTADLTVTDNEGATANVVKGIHCRKNTPNNPGTTPTTGVVQSHQCGGSAGNGASAETPMMTPASGHSRTMATTASVTPDSGNASVHVSSSSQVTRGASMDLDVYVNSQQTLGSTGYSNMRNAYYTYSIGLYNSGGLTHLIDADGSAYKVGGTWGTVTTKPAGFMGSFQALPAGEMKLYNAGPPGDIWEAGHWSYIFDGWFKLREIKDPNGNVQTITWSSASGQRYPVEVEDVTTGRKLTFSYSPSASSNPFEIHKITESSTGNYTEFVYNADDKVIEVLRKDSSNTLIEKVELTYFTDASKDRLKEVVKDGDNATKITFGYDSQAAVGGKITYLANMYWTGGATNNNYFVAPGSGGQVAVETSNSLGGKTKYDFDSSGRLIRTTLPVMNGASSGVVYNFQYDANHHVTQISDGAVTTDFTYNAMGKVTEIDDNNGGVWTFTYEANNIDLAEVEDSQGTLVELDYASMTLPHMPTSITDGDGKVWTKTYNSYGQVLTVVPPSGSPTGTTTYEYEETTSDPNYGFLKKITNGAGNETQFTDYTGSGLVKEIVQTPEVGTDIAFQFAYDGAGRTTRVTQPDGKYREYAYTYRKLSTSTDEAGAVTSYDFCAVCGKLTGIDMPLSKSLAWEQDADHRTTKFTDARSKDTEYEYGLAGELKKTLYPDASYILFRYDDYGRLRETEDTRGHKKQYAYDASGRVEEIDLVPASGTPTLIAYNYRNDGRVFSVTDEVGTTTYSYTPGRRVSEVEYDWSASGLTNAQTLFYVYNDDGTLFSLEWEDGSTSVASWEYGYDGAGRLTRVENSFGETTTFTYDGVGKLKTHTNENGTSTTYTYNQERGWPTQILHKFGSTSFESFDLEYDDGLDTVGNITKVTELDSSEVEYFYDALYRLTSEVRTGTGAYTRDYEYDLAGNMTVYNGSTFASYDDANKISNLSGGSVSYDADGNMTYVSGAGMPATTLSWDARNRLMRQQATSADLSYRYDSGGRRVMRQETGNTASNKFFVFSGARVIGEVGNASVTHVYSWGANGLTSQRIVGSGESYWYHFGPQAETRLMTDLYGSSSNTYRYDGYGRVLLENVTVANHFMFGGGVGYYTDGSAQMSIATHRWYASQLKRWISRDPLGFGGGSNLYSYTHEKPIIYVDPSGRSPSYPPPRDANGKLRPPPIKPPDGYTRGLDGKKIPKPNEWQPIAGTESRETKWKPKYPCDNPGGGQPAASWEPEGRHWDIDDGNGNRTRTDEEGNPLTVEEAHDPKRINNQPPVEEELPAPKSEPIPLMPIDPLIPPFPNRFPNPFGNGVLGPIRVPMPAG